MTTKTILTNGRIFAATNDGQLQMTSGVALILKDGLISHVGKSDDEAVSNARHKSDSGAKPIEIIDLKDHVVTPGFMNGHVHLTGFGLLTDKPDLIRWKNLDDIRTVISDYAKANPTRPRIVCKSWLLHSTSDRALASMLDDLDDPRPIFIEAFDFHPTWCNSTAFEELKVDDIDDPPGGSIERDETTASLQGHCWRLPFTGFPCRT